MTRTAIALAFAAAALAAAPLAARAQDPAGGGAGAPPKHLRIASLAPEGTPWADALARLEERIEGATGRAIKAKLYLNGRQGDEKEVLEKIAAKRLEGAGLTSSGLAAVVPEVSLLELPFLFEDDAEADHAIDAIRGDLAKRFEEKGLKVYLWAAGGWLDFGCAARPVVSLADVRASKPCSRDAAARLEFWRALGAEPVVLAVPEVAAALEKGRADLYDTTPLFATAAGWHRSTKHWTDSNHAYQAAAVVFDLGWWRSLPEAVRKDLEAFAPEIEADARKAVRGLDAGLLDGMRAAGIAVHALPAAERAAMKQAAAGLAAKLIEQGAFSREAYDKVEKALAALRAARAPKADPLAERLAEADRFAPSRGDPKRISDLMRGEYALQEALRLAPQSYEATWRMARGQTYIGRVSPEGQRLSRFEKAMEWGKKAAALAPDRVEGRFWLAIAYGLYGETKGITASLFLVDDMQEELEAANRIDPKYEGGGPPRILGRLYFKLPWAAGGSNKKSLQHLRKAVEIDGTHPFNQLYLAETLIDEDEEDEAGKILRKLASAAAEGRWAPEVHEAAEEARKLLKDL